MATPFRERDPNRTILFQEKNNASRKKIKNKIVDFVHLQGGSG